MPSSDLANRSGLFWRKPETAVALCTAVKSILELKDVRPEQFFDLFVAHQIDKKHLPSARTIRRMTKEPKGKTVRFKAAVLMSGLLEALIRISADLGKSPNADGVLRMLRELGDAHANALGDANVSHLRMQVFSQSIVAPLLDQASGLIGLLAKQLYVDEKAFAEVAHSFFPDLLVAALPAVPLVRHFLCYRFHSNPGRVVKTFTSIFSPTSETRTCTFINYLNDASSLSPRIARGIIIPMREAVYFVGQLEEGAGLKIKVIDPLPPNRRRDKFVGLLLSLDVDEVIATRFLMVPSAVADPAKASLGTFHISQIQNELEPHVDSLRNKIDFTLEKELLLKGKPIGQKALVVEVRNRLTEHDKPLFTLGAEDEFNPADTKHYTFNGALTIGALD